MITVSAQQELRMKSLALIFAGILIGFLSVLGFYLQHVLESSFSLSFATSFAISFLVFLAMLEVGMMMILKGLGAPRPAVTFTMLILAAILLSIMLLFLLFFREV
jgi:hypothetical protein